MVAVAVPDAVRFVICFHAVVAFPHVSVLVRFDDESFERALGVGELDAESAFFVAAFNRVSPWSVLGSSSHRSLCTGVLVRSTGSGGRVFVELFFDCFDAAFP